MKKIITFILIIFLCSCSAHTKEKPEDQLYGKVLSAINNMAANNLSYADFDNILEHISTGETRWLVLYPKLRKEPFSGITYFQEGLDISMSYALANNAPETLKYVNADNFDKICGIPFIEPTDEKVKAHYLKARNSLEPYSHENGRGASCLSKLEQVFSQ